MSSYKPHRGDGSIPGNSGYDSAMDTQPETLDGLIEKIKSHAAKQYTYPKDILLETLQAMRWAERESREKEVSHTLDAVIGHFTFVEKQNLVSPNQTDTLRIKVRDSIIRHWDKDEDGYPLNADGQRGSKKLWDMHREADIEASRYRDGPDRYRIYDVGSSEHAQHERLIQSVNEIHVQCVQSENIDLLIAMARSEGLNETKENQDR